MKKFLYCFMLILLLNQCLFEDPPEAIACNAEKSEVACSQRTVSSNLEKCIQTSEEAADTLECSSVKKTCAEASTLTGVDCTELSTAEILCITGTSGCITPKTCDEVISGASEEICDGFKDASKKCVLIAANTEGETNKNAHCKSIACTDSLGGVSTGQEDICFKRSISETQICYFNGNSACKEAKKCEDIELSIGKTVSQTTCDKYNSDDVTKPKCSADGNKCVPKSYCDDGKPSEHDCSYYALKNEGNICVLVEEDSTQKCKEMSEEDYETKINGEADEICKDKKGDACTIIFGKTFFVECELKEEKCQRKDIYGICNSDDEIPNATNEQCSKLAHNSNGYCIKGLKGCIEVDSCDKITGKELTDDICKNFPAPSNYECVKGDGDKCNLVAKETGKTSGKNSSQALTLSFAMLILILVI